MSVQYTVWEGKTTSQWDEVFLKDRPHFHIYVPHVEIVPRAQCVELELRWQFCVHGSTCPEIHF